MSEPAPVLTPAARTSPLSCPECKKACASPQGLGAHRAKVHGVKGSSAKNAKRPAARRAPAPALVVENTVAGLRLAVSEYDSLAASYTATLEGVEALLASVKKFRLTYVKRAGTILKLRKIIKGLSEGKKAAAETNA